MHHKSPEKTARERFPLHFWRSKTFGSSSALEIGILAVPEGQGRLPRGQLHGSCCDEIHLPGPVNSQQKGGDELLPSRPDWNCCSRSEGHGRLSSWFFVLKTPRPFSFVLLAPHAAVGPGRMGEQPST
ncbi:unnamed protein product [Natator depressus]